jgi:nucleotide-binding universal stress UspA family protein
MTSTLHVTRYLTLDNLAVNRGLARLLPRILAFRYHALPVAKDNGHITVAMADPDDKTACQAIATALGAELYAVQGDPTTIDKLLAEIWAEETKQTLHLLAYHQAGPITGELQLYARYLADLLGGQLSQCQAGIESVPNFNDLAEQASFGHDLVIFEESDQSLLERLLSGPTSCKVAEQAPSSVLIARSPRWPLKKVLLVTRGQEGVDDAAVDWTVRLAQPSKAIVNVLALVPATSAMCQRAMTFMPHGPGDWLATDTPLGRQLRQIAKQLENWEIQGELRFRQGLPNRQIKGEVNEEAYDLVVVAADPSDWWLRRLLGELVNPLLRWIDRPVLIARPITG